MAYSKAKYGTRTLFRTLGLWHFHKNWTPSVGGARLTPSRRAKGGVFNLTGHHVC